MGGGPVTGGRRNPDTCTTWRHATHIHGVSQSPVGREAEDTTVGGMCGMVKPLWPLCAKRLSTVEIR